MEFGIPAQLATPLGTLTFNDFTSLNHYRLTGFTLSKPRRFDVQDYPQRDGGIKPPGFRKGGYIVIDGEIVAYNDLTQRAVMMQRIRAYGNAIQDVAGTLTWTPTGQPARQMAVTILDDPSLDGQGGDSPLVKAFQIQLFAEDPTTYGTTLYTVSSSPLTTSAPGTFTFPFSFPIGFGAASSGGIATCLNAGDAASWPTVRIYGQITAPAVYNVTTGEYVSLPGLSLSDGQYAEIDMRRETVRLNGAASSPLTAYLDNANSTFWALAAGTTVVQLTGSGADSQAVVQVIYRDGYA